MQNAQILKFLAGFFSRLTELHHTIIEFGALLIFGVAIAFICSYEGYITEAGAEGVGRSTAKAVVITSAVILALDALTAGVLAQFLLG